MIRVLHILPNLTAVGGAERMVVNLMRSLNPERFEVGAISLYSLRDSFLRRSLAQSNVPVWYLGKRQGFDLRMFVRIAHVLKSFRPHVVHTHQHVLPYVLSSMLWYRIPARVHTVHTLAEKEVDWLGRWVQRLAFRHGVLPVAVSQAVLTSLARTYGVDQAPTILHGIPVEELRAPSIGREAWRRQEGFASEDVLFVCVARFTPAKNHALLLNSFARGPASDPRAHLLLVGGGQLGFELKKQAAALALQDKVHFLGVRANIPEMLNAADVFVLSSDWEGSSLSSMEAMAAGRPVVCTAAGALPEIVDDGESGLLVPPQDAKALAQAMRFLLENPGVRDRMGKVSVARAFERFDVRVETRAYEHLYESLVART